MQFHSSHNYQIHHPLIIVLRRLSYIFAEKIIGAIFEFIFFFLEIKVKRLSSVNTLHSVPSKIQAVMGK